MSDRPKAVQKARRQRRLTAALRQNLKRRKATATARAGDESAPRRAAKPHDSAGIVGDK